MAKTTDFREEVTNKIIEALQNGTAPWQIPWNGAEAPQNAVTKHRYSGINLTILSMKVMADKNPDPRWCTFKQATDNDWRIKKGEHGTHVILWKPSVATDDEGNSEIIGVIQKVFTVFHASQIDGIPDYIPPEINHIEAMKKADKIISDSGADIRYGGGEAFYRPNGDFIQLPPKGDFKSTEGFYSTVLHELCHWTGGVKRLNRPQTGGKWSNDYAFEELVAEIGSMFVACQAGIPQSEGEFQNHASYIDSWLRHLRNDKNFIFKASAEASKAADFLIKG